MRYSAVADPQLMANSLWNPGKGRNMSIQGRTLLIVVAVAIVIIALLHTFSAVIFNASFRDLETEDTAQNVARVENAFSRELDALDKLTKDWAVWDDLYNFAEDHNQDFVDTNLQDGTFINAELNLVTIVDSHGDMVKAKAFDLDKSEEVPLPQGLSPHLSRDGLLNVPQPDTAVVGIIALDEGKMMVSCEPIVNSLGQGPVRGALIMGRWLNSEIIDRLSVTAGVSLAAYDAGDPQMPADFRGALSSYSDGATVTVEPLDDNQVAGYTVLSDIYGRPGMVLRATMPREIYAHGMASTRYFLISTVVLGAVLTGLTMLLLRKSVISKLVSLKDQVKHLAHRGNPSERLKVIGKDELSSLAADINSMLDALETWSKPQMALVLSRKINCYTSTRV